MDKEKKKMVSADRSFEIDIVEKKKPARRLRFIDEVKAELAKVSWTPREELKKLTKITLVSIFVGSFLIFGIDVMVRGGMIVISSFARWISG